MSRARVVCPHRLDRLPRLLQHVRPCRTGPYACDVSVCGDSAGALQTAGVRVNADKLPPARLRRRPPPDVITHEREHALVLLQRCLFVSWPCMRYLNPFSSSFVAVRPAANCSPTIVNCLRVLRGLHTSSSMVQKPEILGAEEYKTDAKWLKLENIKWKDETGKEVIASCK